MNKFYWIILITILAALVFYFSWKFLYKTPVVSAPTTQTSTPALTSTTSPIFQGETYNIEIKNFAFNPNSLIINKGDMVIWTNKDSVVHLIKGENFQSNPMNQGDVYQFQFKETGSFDYHCAIHPYMKAKIIVK